MIIQYIINKRIKIIKENRRTTHFSNNNMKNNITTWKTIAYKKFKKMLNTRTQKFPSKPQSTLKLYSVKNLSKGRRKISFIKYLVEIVTCHTLV